MVEKHEWSHIAPFGEGQQAAHGKTAEIPLTGLDHQFNRMCHGGQPFERVRLSMDERASDGKVAQ
jgi:hypothetical protein